jgi:hypothetical protein
MSTSHRSATLLPGDRPASRGQGAKRRSLNEEGLAVRSAADSAASARAYGVLLHWHVAPTVGEDWPNDD